MWKKIASKLSVATEALTESIRVISSSCTIMTEDFQILTHTPQQAAQWTRLVAADPERVLSTLALQPGQRNGYGDHSGEIYPSMAAVRDASKEGGQSWKALVKAGIAETLCQNVEEMCTFMQTLPDMPEHLKKQAMELVRTHNKEKASESSHDELWGTCNLVRRGPLEILCNATCHFSHPPTPDDEKVVNSLRKNWAKMMTRVSA
jgi:hypothetical protein